MGIFLIAFHKLRGQLLFHLFSTYESSVVFIKADKNFKKQNLTQSTFTKADADFSDKVTFEFFSQVSGFCSNMALVKNKTVVNEFCFISLSLYGTPWL